MSTPRQHLTNPQPPVVNGVVYPYYGFSLNINTRPVNGPNGPAMEASIACSMYPYREGENGVELLSPDGADGPGGKRIVYAAALDAAAKGDIAIAEYLAAVLAAAQNFLNAQV